MPEIIQIDSNTWRIEDDFVRFFLLEGNDKAVLIDSGVNCPDAAGIAKTLSDKPLLLLNTHGDGDHTSGTGGFSEILIHASDYYNCKIGAKYPDTAMAEIKDGDIIDLGERPLKIIHIPGHTKGSVAVLDVNKRLLYAGDSVQKGHIYMFGNHRDPSQYENSLSRLIAIKDMYDAVYASHDDFLLSNDYPEKVHTAWKKVQNGEVPFEMTDVKGNFVKSYTTNDCGFYTE